MDTAIVAPLVTLVAPTIIGATVAGFALNQDDNVKATAIALTALTLIILPWIIVAFVTL